MSWNNVPTSTVPQVPTSTIPQPPWIPTHRTVADGFTKRLTLDEEVEAVLREERIRQPHPLPVGCFHLVDPLACTHPREQQVEHENQHASWTKCLACGERLELVSRKPKFAGVVEIPPETPADVPVKDIRNDVERMIIDSGCKRSVAGRRWHHRMHVILKAQGLKPRRRDIEETFRFGDGALSRSSCAFVYPIGIYGRHGTIDVAMVKECPPLLSNSAMKQLGVKIDWAEDTITVRAARAYDQPMETLSSGLPSIIVTEYDKGAKFPDNYLLWGTETDQPVEDFDKSGDDAEVSQDGVLSAQKSCKARAVDMPAESQQVCQIPGCGRRSRTPCLQCDLWVCLTHAHICQGCERDLCNGCAPCMFCGSVFEQEGMFCGPTCLTEHRLKQKQASPKLRPRRWRARPGRRTAPRSLGGGHCQSWTSAAGL